MKILLLNQTFYPDVVSTAQHLADLASELARRGHEVTVVTSRRGYDDSSVVFPRRERWRGVEIHRVVSTRFGKGAKWKRAVDFASFNCFCLLRFLFLPKKQDAIVALTSPPLISFLGACLARWHRCKFCYWVMDLNPDEAVAAGWLKSNSIAAKILEAMSRFSMKRAEKIIVLDRFMRERLLAKEISTDKIEIIPPWSHDDDVRFDAAGREEFRREHGLAEKFVVMYSGNHSPCHPLDTLLAAAGRLATNREIVFCFIGGGSEFPKVKRFASEKNLPNVVCLPYRKLGELSTSLSAADLHVIVMGDPFVGIIHPCKIYNVLNVRAPVLYIGTAPSHVSEIFRGLDPQLCFSARHGETEKIVSAIVNFSREKRRGEENSYAKTSAEFAKKVWLPKLADVIAG